MEKMNLSPRTDIQITHANPYLYVVELTTYTDVGTVVTVMSLNRQDLLELSDYILDAVREPVKVK